MVNLPTSMPSVFNATYTPIAAAGTSTQVRHLARLLAAQLAVWANDESGLNKSALLNFLGSPTDGGTDVNCDNRVKKLHRVKRSGAVDDDDEDAFMRDHVARVHTSTKPMNISVVQRSSTAIPPKNAVSSGSNSKKHSSHATSLLPTTGATPARPFSLERAVASITESQREELVNAAFKRILAFESNKNSIGDEAHLRTTAQPSHLSPQEEIHVKILARLIVHAPYSKILYNSFMEHVMSNLKENFEHLMNLLAYVYTHFRGFRFAGSLAETLKSRVMMLKVTAGSEGAGDADDEADEAQRLLLESHRQLMALRAREGDDSISQSTGVLNSTTFDINEDRQNNSGDMKHSEAVLPNGDRSFAFYDTIVNDVLQRFAKASIQAPYFGRFLLEAPVLTTRAISFLKSYCTVPEQAEYGFQVMRTLIELKPNQWREELVHLLFGFSAYEEPTVRDAAIRATCELANSSTKWEKLVEDRAVERLGRILEPKPSSEMFADLLAKPVALSDKWTNETCKLCAQLFLGLLPRNPGKLLSTLADIYVSASDTMCEIGLQSPHFLHLLDNCPIGAESLITRMLRVLTDPRKVASSNHTDPIMPPQDVVDRMRRLYRERANDVRFIIPVVVGLSKQEVIELLPRILQLSDAYVKEVISRLLRGECR